MNKRQAKFKLLGLATEISTALLCVWEIQYTGTDMWAAIGLLAIAFGGYQLLEILDHKANKEVKKDAKDTTRR